MTNDTLIVFALLGICATCFMLNRPRMDVAALLGLIGLVLCGVLDLREALSGFSDPNVLLIAAFFVLGEGLTRTGVAFRVGDWLVARTGHSEVRLLVLLMLCVAGLGSVMSSTGVVSLFIPVALSVAARIDVAPGRLLMPLAFAGLMSGMLTLVGTPPNMVLSSALEHGGQAGFGFFDFTPVGLAVLATGIAYMLAVRRWLGASGAPQARRRDRRLQDLADSYGLRGRTRRLRVGAASPMAGHTLSTLQPRVRHGANVLLIERTSPLGQRSFTQSTHRALQTGDVLLVDLLPDGPAADAFIADMKLEPLPMDKACIAAITREYGLAELLLPPGSGMIGKSALELRLRAQRGLNLIGLRRRGHRLAADPLKTPLRMGDTLLVAASWKSIRELHRQAHDLLVLTLPAEIGEAAPAARRAPQALFSVALTIALMVSGVVPNVIAALIGCLLLGAFRCIDVDGAYRSLHWQSLMLIACMLPFAIALQKTGGIDLIVGLLRATAGEASPHVLLALLFVLTSLVGLFMSNTATAVLMAPIAVALAEQLGLSPYPFAMAVAISASAAFMTPVSSPVNTLVFGPGGYRFSDFVRIGVPLTVLVLALCMLLLPWLFPFDAALPGR